MRTLSTPPTSTAAKAGYARATLRTAAVMADPSASPMDRYRAAEAEEAACRAARQAEAEAELEAGA
jgi:D-serine deaminase-like pyridoxal phosphate-dependent protein